MRRIVFSLCAAVLAASLSLEANVLTSGLKELGKGAKGTGKLAGKGALAAGKGAAKGTKKGVHAMVKGKKKDAAAPSGDAR